MIEVEPGRAVFEGVPEFRHYNPIGTVHGGFAATLLDSALGCAIFSTLGQRRRLDHARTQAQFRARDEQGYRPGARGRPRHPPRAHGRDPEGDLKDGAGKLYAHATTTCMIFPAKG